MADKPSAPLSSELLARKGAANAVGFATHGPASIPSRAPPSYRLRIALFSVALVASAAVVSFVGGALFIGVPPPPAPRSVTNVVPTPPPAPAKFEPASVAAPPLAKPLAAAVADDLAQRGGVKIAKSAEPAAPPVPPVPPVSPAKDSEITTAAIPPELSAKDAVSPPPPRKRPDRPTRAAYRVQLHALGSDAAVRREWRRLRGRHRALFSGLKLIVAPKRVGAGNKRVYRLQLGALASRTQARALCKKLRREKLRCMVVR